MKQQTRTVEVRQRGVVDVLSPKLICVLICLLCLSTALQAQQFEQYQAQKDAERLQRNPYLSEEEGQGKDLLQKYYQSLLLRRGKANLPQVGVTEEGLLKQLQPGLALEGPIKPSQYVVGPFDGISISLWSEVPLSFSTFVTPEGTLIVPTVGEIHVAGHSLAEAKEIVAKEVKKKYSKGEVTVTLISPRSFVVKVAGVVNRPGAFVVNSVDRVDKAVYLANLVSATSLEQPNPLKTVEKQKSQASFFPDTLQTERQLSLRNIRLVRTSGDSIDVDLIRYFATGDAKYNPYLLDGDQIIVPSLSLSANAVTIDGAVNLPGRFEYHPKDSLSVMFKISGGPQADADLRNVELVRFNGDGRSFKRIMLDGQKVLDGELDMPLQPDDRVFVRSKPHLREEYNVRVGGEVRWPGKYAITRDSSKLSEIIKQAGGLTAEAAVAECQILRSTSSDDPLAKSPDYQRLTEMRLGGLDREERDYFNYEAAIKRGQVSVDFKRLFIDGDTTADVILRDGDFILVPSRNRTVYVYGQVTNPGYVTYVPGSDYRYYIEKAGGYSEVADRDKVSIVKAGTKKWVDAGDGSVEEGDSIFISLRTRHDFGYYFVLVRDILTVATAAATVYFLIEQTKK
jgi:protein involved in polysaccharide export with SLBB domain